MFPSIFTQVRSLSIFKKLRNGKKVNILFIDHPLSSCANFPYFLTYKAIHEEAKILEKDVEALN